MSAVVGIDLSTRAIDLVKLDEESNLAEWVRCEFAGKTAWERTLAVRDARWDLDAGIEWWDDVYLVAIEQPMGRGKVGATSVLNRVVGAVAASLPAQLRTPERCWIVKPDEWKNGLGLKGKPTVEEFRRIAGAHMAAVFRTESDATTWQNAMDAYCLALWARDTNAKAVEKALGAA